MKALKQFRARIITSNRNWIQLIVFIGTIAIGWQFYIYVSQALGTDSITVARPSGVEGFLPIGALMGWKYFFTTGVWDNIHPAAMVFLGFAVIISILFKKSFCSWFCPVGTFSEWIWKLGEITIGKNYAIPIWLDVPLRSVKYLLLGFFIYVIAQMSSSDMAAFFQSAYYKIADVKMLHFFTKMSFLTGTVLFLLVLLSLFFKNFWCRYACPYGALLGLIGLFSISRIHRESNHCTNCGLCAKICPSYLSVDHKRNIYSPECSACMDCVNICPSKKALKFRTTIKNNSLRTTQIGAGIAMVFVLLVYCAGISGNWKSQLSENEFRMWLKMSDSPNIQHPSVQFRRK